MKIKFTFNVDDKLFQVIKDYAKQNHINLSAMTEKLWLEHIQKNSKKEKK